MSRNELRRQRARRSIRKPADGAITVGELRLLLEGVPDGTEVAIAIGSRCLMNLRQVVEGVGAHDGAVVLYPMKELLIQQRRPGRGKRVLRSAKMYADNVSPVVSARGPAGKLLQMLRVI